MEIIPAIDLIDGKCVRLTQGDYARKTVYAEDPVDMAKAFEGAGLRRLHLVDLDGAKAGRIVNRKALEKIALGTGLKIDFGGGLRSDADVQAAFDHGAAQITGGSVAVKRPDLFLGWLETYGAEKVILGADAKDGMIAVGGWQEGTDRPLDSFIDEYMDKGVRYVICTDIGRDGMLSGPATDLYQTLLKGRPNLRLVASGGVSSMEDLRQLRAKGLYAAIVGKAFYEGRVSLTELVELAAV